MVHYKTEVIGNYNDAYPHDPTNFAQSLADYLEERYGDGWTLVSTVGGSSSGGAVHIFVPNGRD